MTSPQLIQLPKFLDVRGNLSYVENDSHIPFAIQRVHWIYDVPGGEDRGGIAYKQTQEFIIAMSGAFDVLVDDGKHQYRYSLNRSYMGVYVPAGTWRMIDNFSTNSVAVILASTIYNPNDVIRSYSAFLAFIGKPESDFIDKQELIQIPERISCPKYSVYDCGIIELDRHHSERKGDISVVENSQTVPFDVKRIYYLYDVPGGISRGGHGHRELSQLIVAVSGSFTVTLDDGVVKRNFTLNRPYQGLLVKPGIWRDLDDFSSGSCCLVLASEKYDADDYIRSYDEFINFRKEESSL